MIDLDIYLRCGLHEEANAVIVASRHWRDDPSTDHVLALREAIDTLAAAYVAFGEAIKEFKDSDGAPSELAHGRIAP